MNHSFFACSLIDQLVQQGVRHFCIAPGSRSTPLALAIAHHPQARIHVHFDERALGFYALGLTQGTHSPVAILVTSGSAVGNLLPAVMEAANSYLPLILLTADRPPELRQCGANQTTDQVKLFSSFVRWQFDFPPPDALENAFLRSQVAEAVFASGEGPVHLNCMFRESLWEGVPLPYPVGSAIWRERPQLTLSDSSRVYWNELLQTKERGVILIGRLPNSAHLHAILQLAARLGWPIFADLLSQVRGGAKPLELITHYSWILRNEPFEPDCILHFGDRFISKTLLQKIPKTTYLHIHEQPHLHDPSHAQTARLWVDPSSFARAIHIQKSPSPWLQRWQALDAQMSYMLGSLFAHRPFSEAEAICLIGAVVPCGWSFFLGTSMPVREADAFLFPALGGSFYSNRGSSGIDGTLATAAGIAEGKGTPLLAVIGDQAFLHDLNSLPLCARSRSPFVLIVSNNFGGGIFSHLPVARQATHFESLFAAAHSWTFRPLAEMFSIPYAKAEDRGSLQEALFSAMRTPGPSLIELINSREVNWQLHQDLSKKVAFYGSF